MYILHSFRAAQPCRGCSGTYHPRGSIPLLRLKLALIKALAAAVQGFIVYYSIV